MELTVFRQRMRTRPDGITVYDGEDARPAANDQFFFVADGLGGSAAIYHRSFKRELFEKDQLMDTLFRGVYADYSDPGFVQYVTDSFMELFAVKDCYNSTDTYKKSGYFGSRIAAAILVHALTCEEEWKPEALFQRFDAQDTPEKRDAFLRELGTAFSKKTREDLLKIAKNANLVYESSFSKLKLLGTTLCATIFRERENKVEAIYFSAGDSRPYFWSEEMGLCQVLEDQERADGGMTNLIRANEGESFLVQCRYSCFEKPCVLFNASDGCFDSKFFKIGDKTPQMGFEKLILEKAESANDPAAMGKGLEEAFMTYGRHDDSSTIAMKFFGYESFEAFRESADRRLETIREKYLSKLDNLLEYDYQAEYEAKKKEQAPRLAALLSRFEADQSVRDYCVDRMRREKYPPFDSAMQKIYQRIAEKEKARDRSSTQVEKRIANHFVLFYDLQTPPKSHALRKPDAVKDVHGIIEEYDKQSRDFAKLLESYRSELKAATDGMKSILDQISALGVPSDFTAYQDIDKSLVKDCDRKISSILKFFNAVKEKKQKNVKELGSLRNRYHDGNRKFAEKEQEMLHDIRDRVLDGSLDFSSLTSEIYPEDFDTLPELINEIRKAEAEIRTIKTRERADAEEECRKQYWKEHSLTILGNLMADPDAAIPAELRDAANETLKELNANTEELKSKAELQTELLQDYDRSYNILLRGEKQ